MVESAWTFRRPTHEEAIPPLTGEPRGRKVAILVADGAGQEELEQPRRAAGQGCPGWCDGRHDADDQDAAFHTRTVAERDRAAAALSYASHHDPREAGSGPVIILDPGAGGGMIELEEAGAVRLLAVLQAAGDGSS